MQTVSDRFAEATAASATISTTVLLDGDELPIGDGSVNLDGTSTTRGSVSLSLAPDAADLADLVPVDYDSALAPVGPELQVLRGFTFPDETTETVPLGVFRVDETTTTDDGSLGITVTGLDRSAILIEAVFEDAGQIASGTNCGTAIQALVSAAYPDVTYDFDSTSVTLPALAYQAGDDRWDFCQGIAEAAGCSLYFDARGYLVLRYKPILDVPDLTIAEGTGGTLLGASKRWGRENACNRVVVTGENSGNTPVVGIALDDNPASPTYYYGDFGKVTFSYSSEYVTSTAQANQVAENILAQKLGTGQQISFDAMVNPALEPLDVVLLQRERLGVNEMHILDSLQIPLGLGSMSGVTRVTRVTGN